jgi:hypothetical protein
MNWKKFDGLNGTSFIKLYLAYNDETGEYFIGTFESCDGEQWFEDQDGNAQEITHFCLITNPL